MSTIELLKELIHNKCEDKDLQTKMLKELEKLENIEVWVNCLEAAGVDNWQGYSYAQEMLEGEENV